jgi:hypothetical protein
MFRVTLHHSGQPRYTVEPGRSKSTRKQFPKTEFPTLEQAAAYVRDVIQEPVHFVDRVFDRTGTLFPSGTLRWSNRERQP